MVVYWMMILWLKQSDTCVNVVYWMMIFWLKQSDTCVNGVNGGLLNDDTLIKIRWYDDTLIKNDESDMCQLMVYGGL